MTAVLWRALAILAAIVIPLVLMLAPALANLLPGPWIGAAIAAALGLPIAIRFAESRGQALLGASLAGFAALTGPEAGQLIDATSELDGAPVHDLRTAPIPDQPGQWIAVQGFVRNEWTLDEYRVADGERPDQNTAANAVVVPLLGTQGDEADATAGIVLVARVTPEVAKLGGLQTLRGKLVEVSPDVVESLFVMPEGASSKGRARMLDTFDLPTRGEAYTQLGLMIAACLLGAGLLVTAVPRAGEPR